MKPHLFEKHFYFKRANTFGEFKKSCWQYISERWITQGCGKWGELIKIQWELAGLAQILALLFQQSQVFWWIILFLRLHWIINFNQRWYFHIVDPLNISLLLASYFFSFDAIFCFLTRKTSFEVGLHGLNWIFSSAKSCILSLRKNISKYKIQFFSFLSTERGFPSSFFVCNSATYKFSLFLESRNFKSKLTWNLKINKYINFPLQKSCSFSTHYCKCCSTENINDDLCILKPTYHVCWNSCSFFVSFYVFIFSRG